MCIYIYIVSWFLSFLYPGFILMILNECGSHLFFLATLNGVRRTTACFLEDFQAWLGGDQLPVGDNFTAHLMEFRRTADKGGSQPVPQNGRRSEISEGTFSDMFYSLDCESRRQLFAMICKCCLQLCLIGSVSGQYHGDVIGSAVNYQKAVRRCRSQEFFSACQEKALFLVNCDGSAEPILQVPNARH